MCTKLGQSIADWLHIVPTHKLEWSDVWQTRQCPQRRTNPEAILWIEIKKDKLTLEKAQQIALAVQKANLNARSLNPEQTQPVDTVHAVDPEGEVLKFERSQNPPRRVANIYVIVSFVRKCCSEASSSLNVAVLNLLSRVFSQDFYQHFYQQQCWSPLTVE